MKKFLSILLVLMLAVLPAMAEQTAGANINAQRDISTVTIVTPLLPGLTFKVVSDTQTGDYPHLMESASLNGEEFLSYGGMLDLDEKQFFLSLPMCCDQIMVFDKEDAVKAARVLSTALQKAANDPEFIAAMTALNAALGEVLEQAITEGAKIAAEQQELEAKFSALNYDNLSKELEAIFTPVKTVIPSDGGDNLTEYTLTIDQTMADRLIAAFDAFIAENKEALGDEIPSDQEMAKFKAIVNEVMGALTISGKLGMNDKNTVAYCDLSVNVKDSADDITIALKLVDTKPAEDSQSFVLNYDVKINGEDAGLYAIVETVGNKTEFTLKMAIGEQTMDMLLMEVVTEKAEPSIAYFEGGETISPLKMNSEEFGEFLIACMEKADTYEEKVGEKLEQIIEPIIATLMPAEISAE